MKSVFSFKFKSLHQHQMSHNFIGKLGLTRKLVLDNCVSVIIPNFNNEKTLKAAILSCLIQGPSLKEIIVVDDQSTDKSLDLLKILEQKYSDKLSYYVNPQKGGNNARNYGFSKSSGLYIQWLDADDELLPGKFISQLTAFENNITADVLYSDWYMDFYDSSDNLEHRQEKVKAEYTDFIYEILSDNWSVPANYLFRREIATTLHTLQAWNPLTKIAQDREYVTIAALQGAKFFYTPGFYSIYNKRVRESVSTMDLKIRLGYQLELESTFRQMLIEKIHLPKLLTKYFSVLNSHAINVCVYAPNLIIKHPFSILHIDWSIIHYKKYPLVPLIYIWQHLKYFYTEFIKSQ